MKKAGELLAKTQAYRIDELKGNNISISIGISTAPQDGDCYMDLYKRADQALYQAKQVEKQECATISHENSLLPILLQFQIEGTKRQVRNRHQTVECFCDTPKHSKVYSSTKDRN